MSNLKRIREAAGLSQNKLAKAAGVSPRMIPKYECGEQDINKANAITLFRMAEVLGVRIEDLLEL